MIKIRGRTVGVVGYRGWKYNPATRKRTWLRTKSHRRGKPRR